MKLMRLTDVTRITIVTEEGNIFEKYNAYKNGVELHVQADGRTLKIMNAERWRPHDTDSIR